MKTGSERKCDTFDDKYRRLSDPYVMTLQLMCHTYEMIQIYRHLEVSKIQRILYEKLNFSKLISGDLHKCNFSFYSIFLFSELNAVLSQRNRVEFQDLRVIKKKCDDLNIFHQNFKPMCAMALMSCSNILVRKRSRFKHIQSV